LLLDASLVINCSLEEKMNVTALGSSFSPARIAGNGTSKAAPSASSEVSSASTVVTLSAEGRQAAAGSVNPAGANLLGELLFPTRANAAKLAKEAGEMINAKLDAAGISRTPSFDLAIEDVNSAHVTVKGDRPDAKAIENLINGDPKLQLAVHNTYALASHIPALDKAAAFSQEYAAAQSQAEIDKVLARYSGLLSGILPPTDIGLSFGRDGLTATINGETVHT
jgi:hypothetical protein